MNDKPTGAGGAFDVAAWREELGRLNPWAHGFTIDDNDLTFDAAFEGVRQEATQERSAQGKDVWNAWANGMLALRTALEKAGRWIRRNGNDDEMTRWIALSAAAFSTAQDKHTFDARIHNTALFWDFVFPGDAWFEGAIFSSYASFEGATFFGDASFEGATFSSNARFAWATFSGNAVFEDATFTAGTHLDRVRFVGSAVFSRAKFLGAAAFDDSEFRGDANFEGLESTATFSLASAKFRQVPSFTGASFRGLRLDNMQTPRYRLLGWASDKDAAARFRELKRRANEAQDRDREIEFFAQEIRTSRFHAKGLPAYVPRVWEWRFWFGLLFGTFSDFGRSLWHPVLFWLILLAGSAAFYLGEHEDMKKARAALNPGGVWSTASAYVQTTLSAYANPPACRPQGKEMFAATDAWAEAVNLALANALVVDTGRGNSSRRTYGCLYGFETAGDQEYAKVSSRVSRVSTVQSLASGVLILLFLLAVRNLLRLK